MSNRSDNVKLWRENTKNRIVQAFGGSCGKCGYDKCNDAFDLHHLDPAQKEFGIGYVMAHIISWKRLCKELKKCVMFCANCHREFHKGLWIIPDDIRRFDETFIEYKEKENEKYFDNCPICGKQKRKHLITCSRICAAKKSRKVNWANIDVINLIEIQKCNYTKIGELVGCTGGAVKKRYQKLKKIPE